MSAHSFIALTPFNKCIGRSCVCSCAAHLHSFSKHLLCVLSPNYCFSIKLCLLIDLGALFMPYLQLRDDLEQQLEKGCFACVHFYIVPPYQIYVHLPFDCRLAFSSSVIVHHMYRTPRRVPLTGLSSYAQCPCNLSQGNQTCASLMPNFDQVM